MKQTLLYSEEQTLILEESCLPPLQSGTYTLTAAQETDALGPGAPVSAVFAVEGPRLRLDPSEIDCVYPPAGLSGSYQSCLPQITFRRKTLPWERALDAEKTLRSAADHTGRPLLERPWLALLCLQGEELASLETAPAGQAAAPPPGTYFPKLTLLDSERDELCRYLDLDTDLFLRVMPRPDELALLCHGRKVTRSNQTRQDETAEDWVSILAGNRLPTSSEAGTVNHIYLVSLEGFGAYEALSPQTFPKVRLLVLYDWEFVSVTRPRSFLDYVEGLTRRRLEGAAPSADAQYVPNGYTPLTHHFRSGAVTVSLYRGPLVPTETAYQPPQADSIDGLYRYLPEIGLFDVSYAAAWQLGKLAALHSQSIAETLLTIRQTSRQQVLRQVQYRTLNNHLGGPNGTPLETLLEQLEETEATP